MDRRRLTGVIALIVLVIVAGWLIYASRQAPTPPESAVAVAPTGTDAAADAGAADQMSADAPADVAATGEGAADAPATDAGAGGDVATAPAEVAPDAAGADAETDVALGDPAEDTVNAPAEGTVIPDPGMPTFDIVRVEPTGETVIAGQAMPNATVEIVDGSTVIATAEANEAGEWALALEQPLPAGTHDLAVQTTSEDDSVVMLSDQRVTVSVPEEGSDVLVVLNATNQPATVMQGPEGEQQVAAAPEGGTVTEDAAVAGAASGAAEATTTAAADAAGGTTSGGAAGGTVTTDAATETQVAAAPADAGAEPEASTTGETAGGADVAADAGATGAGEAAVAAAPTGEAGTEAAPQAPETVTADATGTGEAATSGEGTPVEQQVAAATPEEVAPDAGAAPANEPTTAATNGTTAAPDAPAAAEAPAETEVAAIPAVPEPEPLPPPPEPVVTVAAVEADTSGAFYVAGTATTGETVRVYLDEGFIGDAVPSPTGTWLVETTLDLPAGTYTVRADQVGTNGGVVARSEVPFEREVAVAVLKPVGTAVASADNAAVTMAAAPEMDTVIIKRGDNLWRIARQAWGKGVRWSTIYEANTDQIRNPNRIYPGQVFIMPKSDANWGN